MDKNNKLIKDEKPSGPNNEIESSGILLTDEHNNNPISKLLEEAFGHFEKANEENKNGFNCLKKLQKLVGRLTNKKPKIKNLSGEKKLSGFSESTIVPNDLKILLNIQENTLPRTTLTKKVYDYIEANNLKSPLNKRILRVNEQLAKALNLTNEQVEKINNSNNQKDKEGLNFYNIQTWIKKLYADNKNIKQIDQPKVKNDNIKIDNVKIDIKKDDIIKDNTKKDNTKKDTTKKDTTKKDTTQIDNMKNDNIYVKKDVIELKFNLNDIKQKNPINNSDLNINVKKEKRQPILLCDEPNENEESEDEILIVRNNNKNKNKK